MLVESLLLALLGGMLGIVLAFWGTRIINVWIAAVPDLAIDYRVGLNPRVLAGTLGLCLIATLLFGLRPALWLSRRDISSEVRESGGAVLGSLTRKRGGFSAAVQIAMAVALVLGAALLMRSALRIAGPDPRFPLENKVVVQIDPSSTGRDRSEGIQPYNALVDRLASLPGVKALGTSDAVFFGGGGLLLVDEYQSGTGGRRSGRVLAKDAAINYVGRDYFTAMEIPLLRGRPFTQMDGIPDAEKVTIIDESLARKLRLDGNALGCLIQLGFLARAQSDPYCVIGIVPHVPGIAEEEVHAQVYVPTGANAMPSDLCLRIDGRASADPLMQRISDEIHRADPQMPVLSVATLAQKRLENYPVWLARVSARLGMAAGAAALFLATLGIYTVKSCLVAMRTPEIGIRMALGATQGGIMVMVLREGLVLTVAGLLVGLLLGLGVAKVSAGKLYGVSPADPVSIIVTVALLGASSLLASYIPARRAAKVDPMVALRSE